MDSSNQEKFHFLPNQKDSEIKCYLNAIEILHQQVKALQDMIPNPGKINSSLPDSTSGRKRRRSVMEGVSTESMFFLVSIIHLKNPIGLTKVYGWNTNGNQELFVLANDIQNSILQTVKFPTDLHLCAIDWVSFRNWSKNSQKEIINPGIRKCNKLEKNLVYWISQHNCELGKSLERFLQD